MAQLGQTIKNPSAVERQRSGSARQNHGSADAKKTRLRIFSKRGNMDVTFLILVLVLVTFGLVTLFSASFAYAYYNYDDSFYFIKSQMMFAAVGVVAMVVLSFVDYRFFRKYALLIYGVAVALLVIVLFMPAKKGDFHRWITLPGGGSFQPSEVAKFAVIVLCAFFVAGYGEKMKTFRYGVLPFGVALGIVAVLMYLEPHVSGLMIILLLGGIMMFVGGTDLKWFVVVIGAAVAAVAVLVMMPGGLEYAASRIEHWQNPYIDPLGDGFQTIQSLIAIGSGGLMGAGLGDSKQKFLYMPEPQNDFVFAIICEELGFVGATIIIILFALLIWRGFVIAMRAKDRFGSMLAIGLTVQVGLQALLNIAVVTNTIPNTGISLPFFSSGGTALMMLLGQMGVILSVSRESMIEKE